MDRQRHDTAKHSCRGCLVDISDTSMLTVSLVPLQLQCVNNNKKIVLWSNPRYSSTRFCRPLKCIFMKENNDKTIEMYTEIEDEISRLTNTIIYINDTSIISINHALIFSMIDGKYAKEAARLFVHLYPWFYLPASIHKVLIHGGDIIRAALLPIDQLSEEAAETCNKEYKRLRLHHTRKASRINSNTDIFQMMLVSSDPLISSLRKTCKKKIYELSPEVKSLLDFESEDEGNCSNSDTDETGENSDLELDISSLSM
ncbi:uncharacterized protein LOC132945264 [Metopolophium dirhodum]|uniref:uncharacterized protein LOC132945264 n=2 Tax=Metopolophium dirhodum TaxID=44670 RepID=UPI00299068F5|nr:uncharacterized protein LOC132945264 [Metopolophium dirhodum]